MNESNLTERYKLKAQDLQLILLLDKWTSEAEPPQNFVCTSVMDALKIDIEKLDEITGRMARISLLRYDKVMISSSTAMQAYFLTEKGRQYAYEYRHPDYWKDITNWFKSKWWSIPVFLLIVGVPLITAWKGIIEWIVTLFDTPQPQ